jgi:hypothetical protein
MLTVERVRAVLLVLCGLALALPATAAAQAGCPSQPTAQVFMPWSDPGWYAPVSDGGMEAQTGAWGLLDSAKFVNGNEPYFVRSPSDAWSLSLSSGASATSAPMCVSLGHPTLRLFAHSGNAAAGRLHIAVEYTDVTGARRAQEIALLAGDGGWAPTPPIAIFANALSLLIPQQVAFRFTAEGAKWQIDDVYVDPYGKG